MRNKHFKKYFLELLEKANKRPDGRKVDEYREPIQIEYGVSKNAEGSARVKMGKTQIIAGVKVQTGEPYPDKPDEGSMMVTAEFAALSSPEFEPGAPGEEAIELARIVDRGIREGGAIDTKKLCIKKGEKIWFVIIDIYVQNHDGNLIDAAALAAIAALTKAKFPEYDEENDQIDYNKHTDESLPIIKKPIAVSLSKIDEHLIIDPTFEEEEIAEARITITSSEGGEINGMQKSGRGGMTDKEIEKSIDIALKKAEELRKALEG